MNQIQDDDVVMLKDELAMLRRIVERDTPTPKPETMSGSLSLRFLKSHNLVEEVDEMIQATPRGVTVARQKAVEIYSGTYLFQAASLTDISG